jgi:hypothetical protein
MNMKDSLVSELGPKEDLIYILKLFNVTLNIVYNLSFSIPILLLKLYQNVKYRTVSFEKSRIAKYD